jgi:hypothetical protein
MGGTNMIIISITSYPPGSAKDIGKTFLEAPPLPNYIKTRGPYINSFIEDGIKGITIYEFDDAKYAEAHKALMERTTNFFKVPGFTYSTSHWLEAKDALSLVSLG